MNEKDVKRRRTIEDIILVCELGVHRLLAVEAGADPMKSKKLDGYKSRVTQRGYRVVELDAWADPSRDAGWLAAARKRASSEANYQREVLRNWNIVIGDAYFPEFRKIDFWRAIRAFQKRERRFGT